MSQRFLPRELRQCLALVYSIPYFEAELYGGSGESYLVPLVPVPVPPAWAFVLVAVDRQGLPRLFAANENGLAVESCHPTRLWFGAIVPARKSDAAAKLKHTIMPERAMRDKSVRMTMLLSL